MYALTQTAGWLAIKNKVGGLIPEPQNYDGYCRIIYKKHLYPLQLHKTSFMCSDIEMCCCSNFKAKNKPLILLPIYVSQQSKIGSYNNTI